MAAQGVHKLRVHCCNSLRVKRSATFIICAGKVLDVPSGIPAFLATESTPTNRKGLKSAGGGTMRSCSGRTGLFGSIACF